MGTFVEKTLRPHEGAAASRWLRRRVPGFWRVFKGTGVIVLFSGELVPGLIKAKPEGRPQTAILEGRFYVKTHPLAASFNRAAGVPSCFVKEVPASRARGDALWLKV